MNLTEITTLGSNIGSFISGLGVVVGGAWAAFAYFRNKREEKIAAFEKHLNDAVQQFAELSADFQNQIVATLEEIFRPDNPDAVHLIRLAEEALKKPSMQEVEDYLRKHSHDIHDRLLYSMSRATHGLGHSVRFRYASTISPLVLFSPVLHFFFRESGHLVLQSYLREFSVNSLDDYVADSIKAIWSMKQDGKLTVKHAEDVAFHLRSALAAHMSMYRRDVSLVQVISETLDVVVTVVDQYRHRTDSEMWKHHKQDRKARIRELDRDTLTGSMRSFIEWKFTSQPEVLAKCLAELDELETLFADEDKRSANKTVERTAAPLTRSTAGGSS